MTNQNSSLLKSAPNSTVSLVMGIISIIIFWVPYLGVFIGLTLGIIGSILASSGLKRYKESPSTYKSKGALSVGKAFSIIGIIINSIILVIIIMLLIFAADKVSDMMNMIS